MELSKEKLIERAELTDEDLNGVTGGNLVQEIANLYHSYLHNPSNGTSISAPTGRRGPISI
jgi:hypothetical protein